MASHVQVIDSTARRVTIKTTPNKHLSDVLEEACGKLGLNASQYGLKNNNKQVDLSRTLRLSGLSSGAKLELVQLSKSAGVVSVALQLPESEAQGLPSARLTDKFPSTTTLWLVLRKFEAGVAGGVTSSRNLTARGVPAADAGTSGSGRLYYQQPVLQVMNRELGSFTDLQKSLAQLGLNSGSALMRLSFRISETPLEVAMEQIQKYFDSVDETSGAAADQAQAQNSTSAINITKPRESTAPSEPSHIQHPEQQSPESSLPVGDVPQSVEPPVESLTTSTGRPLSVYRPPTSSTPLAALAKHNEADYTPTIEHAQVHQRMLSQSTRNVRLPTEAEIASQAQAEAERIAAIKDVEIKIRFPDQSAVSSKFGQSDTGAELFQFVRECLDDQFKYEIFTLRNPGVRGKGEIITDDGKKLIKDLLLKGRVLVIFGWDDNKASLEARGAKNVLKPELRAKAMEMKIQEIAAAAGDQDDDPGVRVNTGKKDGGTGGEEGSEGKKKLPKWLKGLAKK